MGILTFLVLEINVCMLTYLQKQRVLGTTDIIYSIEALTFLIIYPRLGDQKGIIYNIFTKEFLQFRFSLLEIQQLNRLSRYFVLSLEFKSTKSDLNIYLDEF